MRSQYLLFYLLLLTVTPSHAKPIIVASVGGASDREIHDVVTEEARIFGYALTEHDNYVKHNASRIAVGWPDKIRQLKNNILTARFRQYEHSAHTKVSLILIGKSAGAMQIWGMLDRYYNDFEDFRRIAVVLIDPHGAVIGDGEVGRRDSDDPLWWPEHWSPDINFLRVYHIFQRNFPGFGGGLTGADFPDERVCRSRELTNNSINHTNIPMQPESRKMIQDAFKFASQSRADDVTLEDARGRDTVDGKRDIVFRLDSDCNCQVQVFQKGVLRTTFRNVVEGEEEKYRPIRSRNVLFKTTCKRKVVDKQINLDFAAPTFENIVVTPSTRHERSILLHANRVRDDGYWDASDYRVQVILDGTRTYSGSGHGITLNDLTDGRHSATMRISDGFGRWSDTKSTSFTMSAARPSISFIEPRANERIRRGRNLDISIEASHPSGIMSVSIYLDRISDDEFDYTKICYIGGVFGVGQPERRTCRPVQVVSSGSLDWSLGRHKLIAVVVDNSGNSTTIERRIRIR